MIGQSIFKIVSLSMILGYSFTINALAKTSKVNAQVIDRESQSQKATSGSSRTGSTKTSSKGSTKTTETSLDKTISKSELSSAVKSLGIKDKESPKTATKITPKANASWSAPKQLGFKNLGGKAVGGTGSTSSKSNIKDCSSEESSYKSTIESYNSCMTGTEGPNGYSVTSAINACPSANDLSALASCINELQEEYCSGKYDSSSAESTYKKCLEEQAADQAECDSATSNVEKFGKEVEDLTKSLEDAQKSYDNSVSDQKKSC